MNLRRVFHGQDLFFFVTWVFICFHAPDDCQLEGMPEPHLRLDDHPQRLNDHPNHLSASTCFAWSGGQHEECAGGPFQLVSRASMRMNESAILGMEYDEFCMAGCIFYGVYMHPYRQDPLNVFKVMILKPWVCQIISAKPQVPPEKSRDTSGVLWQISGFDMF